MIKKNDFFKLMMVILLVMGIAVNGFALIRNNGSGRGYDDDDGGGRTAFTNTIEYYVIMGAGHYMNASAAVQQMLYLYEMQDVEGLDQQALETAVDNAVTHMTDALAAYDLLIQKAENTPYNTAVIDKLKSLDYIAIKEKYGLNETVVKKVEAFLGKGDITGVYQQTREEYQEMLELLRTVNDGLQQDSLPGITVFWRLNELMAESSLFGGYVARVFTEISK